MEQNETLSDKAYEAIREAILNLEFEAGQQLSEAGLAKRFGMSRTPVREAIRRLSREGLVRVVPKRGIYVTELSVDAVRMRMLIVGVLQGLASRLAAERLSEQHKTEIQAIVQGLKRVATTGDSEDMLQLDNSLHLLIRDAVGSDLLSNLLSVNRAPLERVRRLTQRDRRLMSEIALLHVSLGEAVIRGDSEHAEILARKISQYTANEFGEVLERWIVPLRNRF